MDYNNSHNNYTFPKSFLPFASWGISEMGQPFIYIGQEVNSIHTFLSIMRLLLKSSVKPFQYSSQCGIFLYNAIKMIQQTIGCKN